MSQMLETARHLQEQQIAFVKQTQAAYLKLVESMMQALPAQPEVPAAMTEAMAPAYEVTGTPEDVASFMAESTKAWTKIGQEFQTALLEALTPKA